MTPDNQACVMRYNALPMHFLCTSLQYAVVSCFHSSPNAHACMCACPYHMLTGGRVLPQHAPSLSRLCPSFACHYRHEACMTAAYLQSPQALPHQLVKCVMKREYDSTRPRAVKYTLRLGDRVGNSTFMMTALQVSRWNPNPSQHPLLNPMHDWCPEFSDESW